jgi:hypothetical protein
MRPKLPPSCPPGFVLALGCAAALCGLLAAWGVGGTSAHAQRDWSQEDKSEEPRVAVYGRVIYEGTERPVRRARVLLVSFDGRGAELSGVTDARGEFRIKKVPAGHYFAAVDAPGIVSPASFIPVEQAYVDKPDASEVRRHFEEIVVEGKSDKRVTVRVARGAAVGGRVTYADGEPAAGLSVHIFHRRRDGLLGKIFPGFNPSALAALRTDDRGVYRVGGLPAGEYVVAVSEEAAHGSRGEDPGRYDYDIRSNFLKHRLLMTFHPSASRVKEAAAVKVAAGEEREGVDITVAERAMRTVSGVVRGRRDRRPVARARVHISRRDEDAWQADSSVYGNSSNAVETDEQGRWQFQEIPDGDYTIAVVPPTEYEEDAAAAVEANSSRDGDTTTATDTAAVNLNTNRAYRPRRPLKRYAPARKEIEVTGDTEEFVVELSGGARISGRIGIEGTADAVPDCGMLFLMRVPEAADVYAGEAGEGQSLSAGSFSFEGLRPGKYFVQTTSDYCSGAARPYARSITFNGRDLLREPLEVAEGAEFDGVRILLSMNPARLRVRVVSSPGGGAHAGNVAVLLVPADDAGQWSRYTPRDFVCYTSGQSECEVSAAPGDYVVFALPVAATDTPFEETVRALAPSAPRVTLRGGESKTIEAVVRVR